jgi:hypothetical protein
MARAVHFHPVVGGVDRLVGPEGSGHADIGIIADDMVRPIQLLLDGGNHQIPSSRPKPDHGQPAGTRDRDGHGAFHRLPGRRIMAK